jgi:RNA polymerase sigma-70 factor (ECF subfamily)
VTGPSDDYDLLAAWRAGDAVSGNKLVERHVGTLYRFFANKVSEGMEDLAQRTLLACVESKDRIDSTRSFRAYLLGIARHVLWRHYRHARRDDRAKLLGRASAESIVGTPSRELAVKEERKLLLHGLRRLPIDSQIALEMFYWEGMSIPEIAGVLEEPVGTLKSRLARGRVQLREEITEIEQREGVRESTLTKLEDWARSLRQVQLED